MADLERVGADDVSRETLARLRIYSDLLRRWQRAHNLVAASTLEEFWTRHILDSAQLLSLIPLGSRIGDLGSGAGFPGLVLAILLGKANADICLFESNGKKASFLAEVIRETGAPARVVRSRIEQAPALGANVITARALAPLPKLVEYTRFHGSKSVKGLFLKGERANAELTEARRSWTFDLQEHPSYTRSGALILELTRIRHLPEGTPADGIGPS